MFINCGLMGRIRLYSISVFVFIIEIVLEKFLKDYLIGTEIEIMTLILDGREELILVT